MASREDPGSGVLLGGRAIDLLGASFVFAYVFLLRVGSINQIKACEKSSFVLSGSWGTRCEIGRWMLARGWVRKAGTTVLSERDTSVAGS